VAFLWLKISMRILRVVPYRIFIFVGLRFFKIAYLNNSALISGFYRASLLSVTLLTNKCTQL